MAASARASSNALAPGRIDLAVRLPPPSLAPLVERYLEIYQGYEPADARYLQNHRGHLMFLRPVRAPSHPVFAAREAAAPRRWEPGAAPSRTGRRSRPFLRTPE